MGLFYLKEDTAVDIKLGPFVDKGDGVTYEVGMAAAMDHGDTGVRLSKNGAAFADRNEATEPSYDAFGYYLVKLDATDTSTPGRLKVIFGDAAVCLPCEANFHVLHANVFDSLFGAAAADQLQTHTVEMTAGVITATVLAAAAIDNATFAADVGSTAYATNIIALAVRKVLDELNLDHLLKVTTGVAADADLEDYVAAGTVMAHALATGADVTTFKPSTDSLQSIRDHADTIKAQTDNLPADPADASDIDTQLAAIAGYLDTEIADIQNRLPAALVSGRMSSDAVAISGSTDGSDKLKASAETIVTAAAAAGTLSTTQMTTTLTEATNDHYNGRIIIWTSGVLKDQATDITDYDGATKMVTYTAVTEAPSDGDLFVLL